MKFIDFFSGIGGFRLGMEQAGHECLGHCEIDKYADISYRSMHNVQESEFYANDITRIEPGELPEVDCYCGGFPCQSFSIAGKRGGFDDTRGTLFFEVMRLAKVRQPKYLFLENVRGLLSHDGGSTFGTIITAMGECGYDAEWQVLNSKDFGVPQNRERVFIIGHLRGASRREVFPIREVYGEVDELQGQSVTTNTLKARYEAIGDGSYIIEGEQYAQEITVYGEVDKIGGLYGDHQAGSIYNPNGIAPPLDTMQGGNRQPMVMVNDTTKQVSAIPVLTPDRPEKRQNGRRFKEDGEPMFTLTSQDRHGVLLETSCNQAVAIFDPYNNSYPKDQDAITTLRTNYSNGNPQVVQNYRIRKLTPKECFRLQGFPDEYFHKAKKVNSNSQLYKQAGNSVTVNVIYEIAKRIGV